MSAVLNSCAAHLSTPVWNATCPASMDAQNIGPKPLHIPFYFAMRQNLIGDIPDTILTLAAPVIMFWTLSLCFHCLDISSWRWLDRYRIHESEEVKSRNLASRSEVFWTVFSQHVVQSLLGYIWLDEPQEISIVACQRGMEVVGEVLRRVMTCPAVPEAWQKVWELRGAEMTHWLYWWGVPAFQLLLSMFILDTWEYFLHRLMHSNKFLYKHFHSVHHRLYIPYAYGAMYNHPLEGFILDTCGALLASTISGLTVRQAMFFFTFSTAKGIHDHCGYNFPLDPFQFLSGNNVEYHDIHHQASVKSFAGVGLRTIGMKSNFSQPFFTHWDTILGTRMTKKDVEERKYRNKAKAT
ncbi:hypothetical protein HYDPIDRAFT_169366 [Hydnomerulius pinastri MD-312]|uniref:Saposin A-type domain-containing protein n=1 Tax=Hydnomerulius pinastri MD-312 TaxID=994086 RepID=A0A0C9VV52_9AGAM|nr:hypothetical protein HYDPIDRAFT_169366 [Hydnomerulius pinastri MD-312]